MSFDAVRVEHVTKTFGATRALVGVDLSFASSTITAIEGPNGSGKSTLVNILATLAKPTRGQVLYGKQTLAEGSAALRAQIGVLAHASMIYPDLSGRENLELYAALYDVPDRATRLAALAERFELGAFVDRPARTYSRGQMQRVALARALLHAPRLLLLDEPSTGLDEKSVARLIEVVREEKARGTIVVLVTHDTALAGTLADTRVRLDRGRVTA